MIAVNEAPSQAENPMRILHLEDSDLDHQLACNALHDLGQAFVVTRVDSIAEYLRAIVNCDFDVVIADYHLPGFTAIDAWHLKPPRDRTPFILLSGAIGESAAVAAIQLGFSDYVHKIEVGKISRVILRALEVHRVKSEKETLILELHESKNRLAQFANHLQDTIETERAAIAREIHDDIGGSLAAIRLDLAWIARHTSDSTVADKTTTAIEMLQHALEASQRIMRDLRPAILDQGLVPAATWLADSFERRTGIKVQRNYQHTVSALPKDIELTAYRTVQEALTNISKYAQCSLVKLDISDFDGVLTVDIADDGRGFSKTEMQKPRSFGLRGLIERAQAVGGWVDVSSQPGRGTTVILSVPLHNDCVQHLAKESDD